MTDDEILGPVDYVVVESAINCDRIGAPLAFELTALVDSELIRILDLVIIERRDDGVVEVLEYEDLDDRAGLGLLEGRLAEVLSAADVSAMAETLAPGTTGAAIVFENTWAAPFADAVRASGARVATSGRVATADLVAALGAASGG